MSSAIEMPCPSCKKVLKIPPTVLGKKIKCKFCEHAFVVEDPDAKPAKGAKPAKPGAKPEKAEAKAEAKPAASSPPPPAPIPFADDDDDDNAARPKPLAVIAEDEVPRCPHCAKELEPPEAIVCIHCGFNNRTREKMDTKKVWEPEFEDWAKHLGPGIIAAIVVIVLLVLNIVAIIKMREWLAGSFVESDDETDALGRKKLYVAPGFFISLIAVPSLAVIVAAGRFAYKRLVKENRPPEQIKK